MVVFGFWPGLHSYISPVSIDTVTDTVEYLGHDTGVSVITLGIPPSLAWTSVVLRYNALSTEVYRESLLLRIGNLI
jgi:hypothetical protein